MASLTELFLVPYLCGVGGFWLAVGVFFVLQVVLPYYWPKSFSSWVPRGNHDLSSWKKACSRAVFNTHICLPTFIVAMCSILLLVAPAVLKVPDDMWAWHGVGNFALRFLLMAFIDDLVFYTCHRSLHRNYYLYKNIHKLHHEFDKPIAASTLYTHWLDFIGSYATEFWVGPLLVCAGVLDIYALCFYNFTGMIGAACIHAGVPLTIPLIGIDIAAHHDSHHGKGHGSYGVWGFVDFLMGTMPSF